MKAMTESIIWYCQKLLGVLGNRFSILFIFVFINLVVGVFYKQKRVLVRNFYQRTLVYGTIVMT